MLFAFATSAEARPQHHHYRYYAYHHYRHYAPRQQAEGYGFSSVGPGFGFLSYEQGGYGRSSVMRSSYRHASYEGARLAGRPAAWCGWYMSQQVGSDPGPQYILARSWAHYGSNAGGPSVGTIVVWRHHVGKIVGQVNGQWIVQSGNDGRAIRARPRSLAGAIAFRRAFASM
jgi:hypothetical protein